ALAAHRSGAPATRRRHRALTALGAALLLVVGIVTGVLAADELGGDDEPGTTAAADTIDVAGPDGATTGDPSIAATPAPVPTTTRCEPLPYQGCNDDQPAEGTDGTACVAGRFDHDGDTANG